VEQRRRDVSLKDGLFIKLCSDNRCFEDDLGEVCDSEVTDVNFECDGNKSLYLAFVEVVFLSILDCF
jgi:hypothetical protein